MLALSLKEGENGGEKYGFWSLFGVLCLGQQSLPTSTPSSSTVGQSVVKKYPGTSGHNSFWGVVSGIAGLILPEVWRLWDGFKILLRETPIPKIVNGGKKPHSAKKAWTWRPQSCREQKAQPDLPKENFVVLGGHFRILLHFVLSAAAGEFWRPATGPELQPDHPLPLIHTLPGRVLNPQEALNLASIWTQNPPLLRSKEVHE